MSMQKADLEKLRDVLKKAAEALAMRDGMNAAIHLATDVRFSPLTSELIAQYEKLEQAIKEEK